MRKCILPGLLLVAALLSAQTDSLPEGFHFGVVSISKPSFRILSDAYINYRFVAGERLRYDTTSFDNRYASYDYCRVSLKNLHPRTGRIRNEYIRAGVVRNQVNKQTSFDLQLRTTNAVVTVYSTTGSPNIININRSFPELKCFRRYNWILSDTLTKKDFRKYIQRTRWYDIRIEYRKGDPYYTLVLKGAEQTLRFQAYPFRNSSLMPEERTRPDLGKLYQCYTRALNQERIRFNKKISKPLKNQQNRDLKQWEWLNNRYFSEEEQSMTRDEWLAYYQRVILNEQEYLPDAPFYPSMLIRHLNYSGYISMPATIRSIRATTPCCIVTESPECQEPQRVIFIDRTTLEYFSQQTPESAGPCSFLTGLIPAGDVAAVIILKNGDLALCQKITFDEMKQEYVVRAELFPTGILTISTVMDFLDL